MELYQKLQSQHSLLQVEYNRMLDENRDLKQKIDRQTFSYTNLDNAKISSMTGLRSMAVFMWVLQLVGLFFKSIGKLTPGDQLLLVLMKLRLNLTNKDIAMRFGICPTQVSKILGHCIPILAHRLKFLIKWPDKNTIMKNLPKVFRKHYTMCRVIIDCSEVFIQRPSNLKARSKTWSNYKHSNTFKF